MKVFNYFVVGSFMPALVSLRFSTANARESDGRVESAEKLGTVHFPMP